MARRCQAAMVADRRLHPAWSRCGRPRQRVDPCSRDGSAAAFLLRGDFCFNAGRAIHAIDRCECSRCPTSRTALADSRPVTSCSCATRRVARSRSASPCSSMALRHTVTATRMPAPPTPSCAAPWLRPAGRAGRRVHVPRLPPLPVTALYDQTGCSGPLPRAVTVMLPTRPAAATAWPGVRRQRRRLACGRSRPAADAKATEP